jgi:hypothetical protein
MEYVIYIICLWTKTKISVQVFVAGIADSFLVYYTPWDNNPEEYHVT